MAKLIVALKNGAQLRCPVCKHFRFTCAPSSAQQRTGAKAYECEECGWYGEFMQPRDRPSPDFGWSAYLGAALIVIAILSLLPLTLHPSGLPGFGGFAQVIAPLLMAYIAVSFTVGLKVLSPQNYEGALSVGLLTGSVGGVVLYLMSSSHSAWIVGLGLFAVFASVGAWAKHHSVATNAPLFEQFMQMNGLLGVAVVFGGIALAALVRAIPGAVPMAEQQKSLLDLASEYTGKFGPLGVGTLSFACLGFGLGFWAWRRRP